MVKKIDSNITGIRWAEETEFGVAPKNASWVIQKPNSYSDWGGEVVTVSPTPIRQNRSRGFPRATELNTAGGFNHNLSFSNMRNLMQGVMFADERANGNLPLNILDPSGNVVSRGTTAVNTNVATITFTANHPFKVGNLIRVVDSNNIPDGIYRINTANAMDIQFAVTTPDSSVQENDLFAVEIVGHQYTQLSVTKNAGQYPVIEIPQAQQATSLNFTDASLNIIAGTTIFVGGGDGEAATANLRFSNVDGDGRQVNNGFKRVHSVSDHSITISKSALPMTTEAAAANKTIQIFFGGILRNERSVTDATNPIKRRSYTIERTLGIADDPATGNAQPNQQSEQISWGSAQ